MAPLPENNTIRYFVDYAVGELQHTMMVRASAVPSPTDVGDTLNAVLNELSSLLFQITIISVRKSGAGDSFSFPVVSGIEGNTYGSGTPTETQAPGFLRFVGRSGGGRRCGFEIFGLQALDDGFRISGGENAHIATVVGFLNSPDGVFNAIDDLQGNWYNYANCALSAYWQRRLRSA